VVQIDSPTWIKGAKQNSLGIQMNHPVKELIWVVAPTSSRQDAPTNVGTTSIGQGKMRFGRAAGAGNNEPAGQAHNLQTSMKNFFNFSGVEAINGEMHAFDTATLKLNGHARFENVKAPFFRDIQPMKYHSSKPKSMIYNYCFALDPEDWKPTGSINMSRIDTVKLELSSVKPQGNVDAEFFVFARSINMMKIVSGMAGLKYAN
jgi:hypothetical protein